MKAYCFAIVAILLTSLLLSSFFSTEVFTNNLLNNVRGQLQPPSFANNSTKSTSSQTAHVVNKTTNSPRNNTIASVATNKNETASLQPVTGNFVIYRNPAYRIEIQFPSNWRASTRSLSDYTQIVSFFSPLENISDTIPVQVGISTANYAKNITLDEFTALTLNASKALGVNVTESKDRNLSGMPAHQITIRPAISNQSTTGTTGPKILQIWTVRGNNVYIITYTAIDSKFENYLPVVSKMIDSFVIR
jgi:uncharacterized Zn-finger protein